MSCLAAPDDYPELSQRQLDVIKLMTEGLRLKEMAFELGISEGAVNKHISCIRKKYQADTNAQAVWRHAQRRNKC
ncbi:response regulator transcription factor [Ponticaulis sp.]|uniref:response regulator transcription factor n=1 Tax=Ponticaulis sp. TaxID=2020902 RepID=UPI000B756999|nr:hypothetical protein [Ponticaulis sp.]OUX97918.1 MAG: hypothetical protein CBB65_12805 [Hyphomonadaceae bacterium TMED5]|tara:strand:+ start:739 stop:963 length:225 start_codon:yes stop_codon:yes gene_type:complete